MYKALLILFIFSHFTYSEEIKDLCEGQRVTMAKATLSNEGKAKMIKYALEQATPFMEQQLNSLNFPNKDMNYDSEKCKPEVFKALSKQEQENTSCLTLPNFTRVGTGKSVPIKGDAPFNAKIRDVSLSNIDLDDKGYEVSCNNNYCDIVVQVNNAQADLDISLDAVEDNGDVAFGVDNLSVKTSENAFGEKPMIGFRAHIGEDGKIQDFVKLPDGDFTAALLPPGSLHIGVNGKFSLEEAFASSLEMPQKLQSRMETASIILQQEVSSLSEQEKMSYDPEARIREIVGDEDYEEYIALVVAQKDKMVSNFSKNFHDASTTTDENGYRDSHTMSIMSLAMRMNTQRMYDHSQQKKCWDKAESESAKRACRDGDSIDNVELLLSPIITKTMNSSLRGSFQDVIQDLDFIHKSTELPIGTVSLQAYVNYSKIHESFFGITSDKIKTLTQEELSDKNAKGLYKKILDDPVNIYTYYDDIKHLVESLQTTPLPEAVEMLEFLKNLLEQSKESITDHNDKRRLGLKKIGKKISAGSQHKRLNRLLKAIDKAKGKVAKEIENQDQNFKLGASVKGFSNAGDQLNVLLSGCSTGCEKVNIAAINEDINFLESHKCGKKYDMAASINIEMINNYLASLHKNGFLDICMNHQEFRVCENAGFFSTKHKLTMSKPPRVVWDPKDQSFELKIPKVEREMDAGVIPGFLYCNRDATKVSLKFKPVIHKGGTQIGIEGVDDIETSVAHDDKSKVCKLLVAAMAPYAAIALEATHRILQEGILMAKKDDIQDVLEEGVDIPESLPVSAVKCIDGSDNHITIYSDLK